ncbi:MAG: hypothetical protein ACD_55C00158G0002 [uncultured bacterium]|uniref:Uncharacterized protein n=1 Tax=Citrifermentans bemidjiense (strain ATCC BAA-1014 / DSM 16622 / JCM 12645 / Bem) TaxID=404380 RepID=B5EIW3_CITBB|nr:hypothetical protein [Citrifermentans bemidjiense]ACH39918.1 hypothetical protein Gbem_2915 [Citrifermentans bemidjiense Bem]EKD59112.1 MAG: hypothetical protein ACD_55C00158G0002 [uncultured bacterium]
MLIQVAYDDEKYDYVKDFMLEKLIDTGAISKFRRSSGWVHVGVDPIRKRTTQSKAVEQGSGSEAEMRGEVEKRSEPYTGIERRAVNA